MKRIMELALLCTLLGLAGCDWHDSPTGPDHDVPDIEGVYGGSAHYEGGDPGYQEFDLIIHFTLHQEGRDLGAGIWAVTYPDGREEKYDISGRILEGRIEMELKPRGAGGYPPYRVSCYFDHNPAQDRFYLAGDGRPPDSCVGCFFFSFWALRE
jgi:hypothetical protein